jgi:hypothetical protein
MRWRILIDLIGSPEFAFKIFGLDLGGLVWLFEYENDQ